MCGEVIDGGMLLEILRRLLFGKHGAPPCLAILGERSLFWMDMKGVGFVRRVADIVEGIETFPKVKQQGYNPHSLFAARELCGSLAVGMYLASLHGVGSAFPLD